MTHHIIRTAEELEALDPGTYLVDVLGEVATALGIIDTGGFPLDDTDVLAVIVTGEQVRAARKALEDA